MAIMLILDAAPKSKDAWRSCWFKELFKAGKLRGVCGALAGVGSVFPAGIFWLLFTGLVLSDTIWVLWGAWQCELPG